VAGNIAKKTPGIVDKEFIKSASFIISNCGSFIDNKILRGIFLPNMELRTANLASTEFS